MLSGISPIGSRVGSAKSLSPSRTMWTHRQRPSQIGVHSTDRILRATNVDAHCGGPQPERICVPYACPCPGSPIRTETASLGCSHERRMDHRERMHGASGPHSATVSREAVRWVALSSLVTSVPIRCVRRWLHVLALDTQHAHQRLIAHELCHHRGFFGSWHLALRVDSGWKRMETYVAQ